MSNIEALLTAAIERANKQSPGLLGWSDIRFELDKLRSEKVRDIVASLFAGSTLEQINEAYQIVLEKEQQARQPPMPTLSSTQHFEEHQKLIEVVRAERKRPVKKKR